MFSAGMTVRCRGENCIVVDSNPLTARASAADRIRLRAIEGPLRNQEWPVLYPLEAVEADELPELSLDRARPRRPPSAAA